MPSIVAENIGVHYLVPQAKSVGLMSSVRAIAMGGVFKRDHGRVGITALDDISLNLKKGDRLGLIGHNGAGKTTLLRVLAGILPPTSGRLRVSGRVSSLMSIHIGMDAYSTGFENIRTRSRLMGFDDAEIDAAFDDIASFSELNEYLSLPIKTYSAGMRLRLAFSIATAFNPDIIIMDEWLSAGDEYFQRKARDRMVGLIDRTGIIVFASHNKSMMSRMCNKAMVLSQGKAVFVGGVEDAIEKQSAAVAEVAAVCYVQSSENSV